MQNKKTIFLPLIYSKESTRINEVNFTPREIDVMACLLNARGTSKTSFLLDISPKTVRRNIENLRLKLDLEKLGNLYSDLGNYAQAEKFIIQSLELHKKRFSKSDSIVTFRMLLSLGNIYKNLGQYSEAKLHLEKALTFYENHYGNHHIETGKVVESLGHVYFLEGNLSLAEKFFGRGLAIFQRNNHPREHWILESFADLEHKKFIGAVQPQDIEGAKIFKIRAIDYLTQALKIIETHFPADSPHIIRIQEKLKALE